MHDFQLVNADTDSISFCRRDGTPFSKEEQTALLAELNSLYPEKINWEHDGIFKKVVVLKAKNYILQTEDGKVKTKGSAIKATLKEPALKEFINRTVQLILDDKDEFKALYDSYVKEILNITDISRWCSKKSITAAVLDPKRTNEQKVFDIIQGKELVEGDKIYIYFKEDGSLSLREDFANDHCRKTLLKKLYNTSEVFESVLMTEELYLNYSLKRNQKALEAMK